MNNNDKRIYRRVEDENFAAEVAKRPLGAAIKKCLQCGTCSATCMVHRVNPNYNPRQLIAQTVLGLRSLVLHSPMIWICARCNYCTARCPKDVRPGEIITAIREIAIEEGIVNNKGVRHSKAFKEDILATGKLNEAFLPLKTLHQGIIGELPYLPSLFKHKKLPKPLPNFLLPKIEGIDDLRRMADKAREIAQRQKAHGTSKHG